MRPLVVAAAVPRGAAGPPQSLYAQASAPSSAKGSFSAIPLTKGTSNGATAWQGAKEAQALARGILEVLERVVRGATDLKPVEEDTLQKGIAVLPGLLKAVLASAPAPAPQQTPASSASFSRRDSSDRLAYSSQQNQPTQYEEPEITQPVRTRNTYNDDWREQPVDWMAQKRGGPVIQESQPRYEEPEYEAPVQRYEAPVQRYEPVPSRYAPVQTEYAAPARAPPAAAIAAPAAAAAAASQLHWLESLKTKSAREEAARRIKEEEAYYAEEAKWEGVPVWKRKLLEEKDRKREEAEQPAREAERLQREARERFNALPAWKQKLVLEKGGAM